MALPWFAPFLQCPTDLLNVLREMRHARGVFGSFTRHHRLCIAKQTADDPLTISAEGKSYMLTPVNMPRRRAPSPRDRLVLLEMALAWSRLAEYVAKTAARKDCAESKATQHCDALSTSF
jgi:hypothetical protein